MANETVVPIQDPNRGFRVWMIDEIYTGPDGSGAYVPNVDDLVLDWEQGFLRVESVDSNSLLSTLKPWELPAVSQQDVDEDTLVGTGPGRVSESFRAKINDSVVPYTLSLDGRLHIYGSTADHIKVFRGTDISSSGEVISAQYNQSGDLVSENIPLELATMPDADNKAIKTPKVASTVKSLEDGDLVTAVVYDSVGGVISTALLVVEKTNFIRTSSAGARHVAGIHLESSFISSSDPRLVEVPINVTLDSVPLTGVVTYSDGSTARYPVDGTKFSLIGMNNYVATILGQRAPLVLRYNLSPDEYSYDAVEGTEHHLTASYELQTVEADGTYSVKLFGFPSWDTVNGGYKMEYYFYNLDRDQAIYATPFVEKAQGSDSFDGTEYNQGRQQFAVAVDIEKLNAQFSPYRHVQTFGVLLQQDSSANSGTNWTIEFSPGQNPVYGVGLAANVTFNSVNNWTLDISCGLGNQAEWIDHVYRRAQPLYNQNAEAEAPEPTHAVLVFKNTTVEIPVSQWDSELTVANDLDNGETLFIRFIRRTTNGDLQLGMGGLAVHNVTA